MKRLMSLRIGTKLVLICLGISFVVSFILIFFSYQQAQYYLLGEIKKRARDYAALGALSIPVDDHTKLTERSDEDTEAYARVLEALSKVAEYSTDMAFVYTMRKNQDGTIMFIADPTEDEEDRSHIGDVYEDSTDLLVQALDGITEPVVEKEYYTDEWGTFLSGYAPLFTSDGRFDGLLCVDISKESINRMISSLFWGLVLSAVVLCVLLVPVSLLIARSIVRPLQKCVSHTGLFAVGDFSQDMEAGLLSRKDEIGDLARAYAEMTAGIRSLIKSIKTESAELGADARELTAKMEESAVSISAVAKTVTSVMARTQEQAASVTETQATLDDILKHIEGLDNMVADQSACVMESSSSNEEMVANIRSVVVILQKNFASMKELLSASSVAKDNIREITEFMSIIQGNSDALMEAVGVIQGIAGQTNLLAMNAAIEAAHAGEAGKGFSVVSDEIRKLAENSANEGRGISDTLTDLKTRIDTATVSSNKTAQEFERVSRLLAEVEEQENVIKKAMEEQEAGSSQILEAIGEINSITSRVKDGSAQMLMGSKEARSEMVRLSGVSEAMKEEITQMTQSAASVDEAVRKVNHFVKDTADRIARLAGEVDKFSV